MNIAKGLNCVLQPEATDFLHEKPLLLRLCLNAVVYEFTTHLNGQFNVLCTACQILFYVFFCTFLSKLRDNHPCLSNNR